MPGVSAVQTGERALVKVLVALGTAYNVPVRVNRDSADSAVTAAYEKLVLKMHPDRGSTTDEFQKLQDAKQKWDAARQASAPRGPRTSRLMC